MTVWCYGSPFIFRPPEALITEHGIKATVDGFKYDMYTVGVLATEMFTQQSILKCPMWEEKDPKWSEVMYPRMLDVLEKRKLKKLIKNTLVMSKLKNQTLENIVNFIHACSSLNPRNRPTADEASEHKIFGGSVKFRLRKNDVWKAKASTSKVKFLLSLFIGQASAYRLPKLSDFDEKFESVKNENPAENEITANDVTEQLTKAAERMEDDSECRSSQKKLTKRKKFLQWMNKKKSCLSKRAHNFVTLVRRCGK